MRKSATGHHKKKTKIDEMNKKWINFDFFVEWSDGGVCVWIARETEHGRRWWWIRPKEDEDEEVSSKRWNKKRSRNNQSEMMVKVSASVVDANRMSWLMVGRRWQATRSNAHESGRTVLRTAQGQAEQIVILVDLWLQPRSQFKFNFERKRRRGRGWLKNDKETSIDLDGEDEETSGR